MTVLSSQMSTQEPNLFDHFLDTLASPLPREGFSHLRSPLLQGLAKASRAHPEFNISAVQYVSYIGNLTPKEGLQEWVSVLHWEELYLTCACVSGCSLAIDVFESEYMALARAAVARITQGGDLVEETQQEVRLKLLVRSKSGNEPKIAQYKGIGDLQKWVAAGAVRTALNLMRTTHREVLTENERLFDLIPKVSDNIETAHMKNLYRTELRKAFVAALKSLPKKEQTVLRYHYVDKLNIDQIGLAFQVHRTTAYRWMTQAQVHLVQDTQQRLRGILNVETQEFDSIMQLIKSQLDLSILGCFTEIDTD